MIHWKPLGAILFAGFNMVAAAPRAAGAPPGGAAEAALAAEPAADFFVATVGDDSWSGRLAARAADGRDGPFLTLARAQAGVRELKAREPERARPIVIHIREGFHELPQAITFRPEDSGSEKAPVIYAAYPGERPILSGGRRLAGWKVGEDGRWRLGLAEVKSGAWRFAQLFVGETRRFRPRLPTQGWYRVAEQLPPSEARKGKGHDRFRHAADDIRPDWQNRQDLEVLAIHIWSASRLRIAELDGATRTVTFTGPTRAEASWAAFSQGNRFAMDNVKEALGSPGQWYLDQPAGELTYVPVAGEAPETTPVVAPRLERLLVFEGDPAARRWVEHIHLRGLTLAHTNWVLPPEGYTFPQAEVQLSAAVEGVGARRIVLDSCAVRHTGGYAIAWGAGSSSNVIERCELVDLGGGGVKIGQAGGAGSWSTGQPRSDDPESHVAHNAIRDCLIAHGGRLHMAAVGVWIGHASHTEVSHNDIQDFYYTAVSVGWVWGYGQSLAHHNEIAHNHMYRIGQGVLSDLAGVYTLGISPGTTVHHNHIHEVDAFDYGGWGLYTDEGSTGIIMEKNLVYDTKTGGFHQHYGKENIIRNNIFAFSLTQQLQRSRAEPHLSFTFERNIVYWENESPLLAGNWQEGGVQLDHNVYWNGAGKPVRFPPDLDLEGWRRERQVDLRSVVADPRFQNAAARDFRLLDDSPALALGFERWDLKSAGRRGERTLTGNLPPVPAAFSR